MRGSLSALEIMITINDERLSEQVLAYLMKEQKYGAYMIKAKK